MRIGAVSGYSSMYGASGDYKINSIYGNPGSMDAISKIGEDDKSGRTLAVVSKDQTKDEEDIRANQSKPFDLEAAVNRAKQGMATQAGASSEGFNINDEMQRLMQGSRFSAETIPMVAFEN